MSWTNAQGIEMPEGTLWQNDRKSEPKHPDYTGSLELSREVVNDLVAQMNRGEQFPKIEISGWRKTKKDGTMFLSISGKKPYVPEGANAQTSNQAGQPAGQPEPTSDETIPF